MSVNVDQLETTLRYQQYQDRQAQQQRLRTRIQQTEVQELSAVPEVTSRKTSKLRTLIEFILGQN